MKKDNIKKLISAVVVGSMIVATGVGIFAFAGENNPNVTDNNTNYRMRGQMTAPMLMQRGANRLETTLEAMVKDGTITQEKMDSITAYIEEKHQELQGQRGMGRGMGPGAPGQGIVEDLEQAGIITSAEADAIRDKNDELMNAEREAVLNEQLSKYVEDGTITQAQVDKIIAYMEQKQEEHRLDFENTKDMTAEERKAYFDAKKDSYDCSLEDMVTAGIITQEQADKLIEGHFMLGGRMGGRIGEHMQGQPGMGFGMKGGRFGGRMQGTPQQ